MTILTRDPILKLIHNGEIEIDPYSEDLVGPASIDLRLGSDFRVFKNARKTYDVLEDNRIDEILSLIHI